MSEVDKVVKCVVDLRHRKKNASKWTFMDWKNGA